MKSGIYVANPTAVALGADSVIPLGAIVRRFGCALNLNGNGVNLLENGYYDVKASVSYTPTAAGVVTVALLADGVAVPGASAAATAAAGDTINLSIVAMVKRCCDSTGTLTLQVDAAGTLVNVAVVTEKVY